MVVYWKKNEKWESCLRLLDIKSCVLLSNTTGQYSTLTSVEYFSSVYVTIPKSVFNRIIFFSLENDGQASTILCCQLKGYFSLLKYSNIYFRELWTRRGLSTPMFRITCPKFLGFCRLPETAGLISLCCTLWCCGHVWACPGFTWMYTISRKTKT